MRTITAKFKSICPMCKLGILPGEEIKYDAETKKAFHPECAEGSEDPDEKPDPGSGSIADRLGFK